MNRALILIIIPLVVVGIVGLRLITHNANSTNATQVVNADDLRLAVLKIDGMYCASCPYNVENALKDSSGVVNATVGFVGREIINGTVEGRGEVVYDTTKINPEKMLQAILPYKGEILDDEKTNSTQLTPLSKAFSF